MSPLKKVSPTKLLQPMTVEDKLLSINDVEPVVVDTTPFTLNEQTLVDVR
jgi:hypothetical protein